MVLFCILVVVVFCVVLVVCSKINQENYFKFKVGMSKVEVEVIFGKFIECFGVLGMFSCIWGDEKVFISVQYVVDKVLFFFGQGFK